MKQNNRIINEITYRLKSDLKLSSDVNLELLFKTLELDVIFYLPDSTIFLNFLKYYISIICKKYKKIDKIFLVVEDNMAGKADFYKTVCENTIAIITEKELCNETVGSSILVFDDLKSIGNFTDLLQKNDEHLKKYICSFGFTTSPFFFYDLYTSTDVNFTSYAPIIYGQNIRWFYKKALFNTEIKTYKKFDEEIFLDKNKNQINLHLKGLCQIVNEFKNGEREEEHDVAKRIIFLLYNGIYKTNFILDVLLKDKKYDRIKNEIGLYHFTSNKLDVLINEVFKCISSNIYIIFNSIKILDIVYNIIIYELKYLTVVSNDQINYVIHIRSNDNVVKKIYFMIYNQLPDISELDIIISFDFKPINTKAKKIILCQKSNEDLFENLINFEKKIETEIKPNFKIPKLLNTGKIYNNLEMFVIKIHSEKTYERKNINLDDLFQVKEFDTKKNTLYVEKKHNFSYVAFKILERVYEPLEFDFIKPNHDNISVISSGIEFGTISNKKTFLNSYKMNSTSYVFFRRDVIAIYFFGKMGNFKLKISQNCFEDYVFIEKDGFVINFYICLDRKPKIFKCKNSLQIHKKLSSITSLGSIDRYNLFESVVWSRCSIEEVPFLVHRDDIKISFDLKNNADFNIIKEIILKNKHKHLNIKTEKRIMLYETIDCYISFFARYQNIALIFSNLKATKEDFLSIPELYEEFSNLNYDDHFYMLCLISQKERYLNFNLTKNDCKLILKYNIFNIVNYLLVSIDKRFLNFIALMENYNEISCEMQERRVKHAVVTPLRIVYKLPVVFESNRILREFDYEKFLRISFREEDLKTKIKDTVNKDQNFIYDYFRNILNEGIFVGKKKYFFVAMTTSQMKLHNVWFLTPYFSKNTLIGPDYIRNWLGDFSQIKNIGKYAMRLGQALSSTIPTVDIIDFIEIEDNIKNGFTFTDGVGIISLSHAKIIAKKLGLDEIPSAFQIRFGGYKGVIVAHPINSEDKECFKDFNINKKLGQGVLNILRSYQNSDVKRIRLEEFKDENLLIKALGEQTDDRIKLILRKSMRKFISQHRTMECITHSATNLCYLNRQIINILEGLGINVSIFVEHQDNYVLSLLNELLENPVKYVRRTVGIVPCNSSVKDSKIFKKILIQIFNKITRDLYKKNKILIKNGAVLLGTVDELMVLKENEVFIKVKKDLVGKYDNFVEDGDYVIVIGPCIVVKNPCLHPGDIRPVIAVNKPELGFMRSILVFNQVGQRPISNMCSGSDLDGDMYTIIWEKNLIPKNYHDPSLYEDQTFLSKEVVCLKDIVNFYIRYIRNFHLGHIAHAHMVYCDLNDVKSENAKLLAELFNKSIDFPRTGFVASVPESLVPLSFPDFLQIPGNIYPSFKSLGILYRRSFNSLINTNLKCECQDCLSRFIDNLNFPLKKIFEGSQIKFKKFIYKNDINISNTEKQFYKNFKKEINILLKKFKLNKEDELLLQFPSENDEKFFENILTEMKKFFQKIKNEIKIQNINEMSLLKMSEECTENINSLPLSIYNHDRYKFSYNHLYKKKYDNFFYNSNIFVNLVSLKSGTEEILNTETNDLYLFDKENMTNEKSDDLEKKYIIKNDKIYVYTDVMIYKRFCSNINRDFDDSFGEIFNLLFLCEFFDSKFFDLVFVFFLFLQSKVKANNKIEISKALYQISREFYKNPTDEPFSYFIYKALIQPKEKFYLVTINQKIDLKKRFQDNSQEVKLIIDGIARTISSVGYLFIFRISLVQKYLSLKNFVSENYQKQQSNQSYVKKGGQGDLVIKGMFDTSDEVKLELYKGIKHMLHKDINVYSPKLMNQGFCEMETHKINVKEFFINTFFNYLHPRIQKNEKQMLEKNEEFVNYLITITILPGKFYIYDVPNSFLNENMTIETLSSSLQFYKRVFNENFKTNLKCYFFNNNDLIDEKTRKDFMIQKNIKFDEKKCIYTFSMVYNNVRYQIYYDLVDNKLIIKYITKGRSVAGKLFILNDADKMDKDAEFEIMYEEIILKQNFKNMTAEEEKLLDEDLLKIKDDKFIVSKSLKNCKNFRFEIDIKLSLKKGNNIELINRRIFTGGRDIFTLEMCHKRLVVSSNSVNEQNRLSNVTQFISLFEKSWEIFLQYYA